MVTRSKLASGEREMEFEHRRMRREFNTIACMIEMYCRGKHGTTKTLCAGCTELLEYARLRLYKCPFQEGKTTCLNCKVHCYKPAMREQARTVMRYAGPRMFYTHPVYSLYHFLDGRRKEPLRAAKKGAEE